MHGCMDIRGFRERIRCREGLMKKERGITWLMKGWANKYI